MIREDWVEFIIDEIISEEGIFADGDWVESKDQDPKGDVRLIQLADIGDGRFVNKSNRFLTNNKAKELNCTFLEEGDILVARMPFPLGRATLFPLKGKSKYITVVDVAIIRHKNRYVDSKFLLHNINSPESRRKIEELQSGTTRKRISRKNLSKIKFPLAPLPEQRAIVAKIEELFSELDSGIASLKKAKDQLEVYRQAVLKAAFEGKLTREWREKNSLKIKNWDRVRLDDISSAIGGYAFKSKDFREEGKYQVIRIGNIRQGEIRYEASPVFIENVEEKILKKYKLNLYDILISLTGTRNKRDYGYTALVDNKNLLLNQRVASIRFNNRCNSKYFLYYSWTNEFKNQFFASETGNVGQGNVGMKSIRNTTISLPTIEEQEEIIKEIESRLSVCENIEATIEEALEKAEALRQSILKKAFEGKLLSNEELEACRKESDWEPAEDLLKGIKEDKKGAKSNG